MYLNVYITYIISMLLIYTYTRMIKKSCYHVLRVSCKRVLQSLACT